MNCLQTYLHRPRCLHAAVFIYFVTTGGRFTAPFLEDVANFSDTVNGLTLAAQVGIDALLGPAAGTLADVLESKRFPNHRHRGRGLVMTLGVTVGTAAFILHGVVAYACDEDRLSCSPNTTTTLHIFLRLMFAAGNSFVYPVLNGITLAFLDDVGCPQTQYGRERLFGAVSWAVTSVIVGWAIDVWGFHILPFLFAPIGYCLYMASIVAFVGRPGGAARLGEAVDQDDSDSANEFRDDDNDVDHDVDEAQVRQSHQSISLLQMLALVCGTVYGMGFIASMLTLAMGMSIVESLIFLFFEELGGSFTLMGLSVVVTVIFEIPVFHCASSLLEKFGSGRLQQAAAVAYMVRVIGYTLIPEGAMAWVLLLEPLHGITYGCAATSSVDYMARLTPKGYESTAQGLLSGLRGIGSIAGLSLGGWIDDTFGPKILYRTYASIVSIGLGLFLFTDRQERAYRRVTDGSSVDDANDGVGRHDVVEMELPTCNVDKSLSTEQVSIT